MEISTDSSAAGGPHHQKEAEPPQQHPHLPPGFRFHPTDEELVVHYLKRKAQSVSLPVSIIAEVDLYKFDPWELPAKAVFGEHEWYFFSPRDRKYPNGARPNRAATSGYWKATGTDKPVMSGGAGNQKVGVKKALVFYGGKPPRGVKTNWIMHEYRLIDHTNPNNKPPPSYDINKKRSLRLDDWVLCRIYKKSNANKSIDQEDSTMEDMMMMSSMSVPNHQLNKQVTTLINYTSLIDHQAMYDDVIMDASLSHLPSASASANVPLKRTLQQATSLFWGATDYQDPLSSGKKPNNHNDDETNGERNININDDDNNNMGSFGNLLNQQPMLGALQQYPLSGLNWYS